MTLALAGIAFAVVALGVLSVVQQARLKREKEAKVRAVRSQAGAAEDAAPGEFFVARYRGNKARFFRVYPNDGDLLFIYAGPFVVLVDPEIPRGTDGRHWAVRSAGLFAVGAAAAVATAVVGGVFVLNAGDNLSVGTVRYGVVGVIGLLAVGVAAAGPVTVWRITRRAAELDAMSLGALRELAETDDLSFRATPENVSDVTFAALDPAATGEGTGATVTFRHTPTGRWTIETTTARDTRDAIAAFREAFGRGAVVVRDELKGRLSGRLPATPSAEWAEPAETFPRGYGFPLLMLAGFAVGATIATATAFVLSAAPGGRFSYVGLLKLLFALGTIGTYTGHVIGAAVYREAGLKPFGLVPLGAWAVGGTIVLGGSFAVTQIVWLVLGPQQ